MRRVKRIEMDGEGPFSEINTFSTTINMASYLEATGRAEIAKSLLPGDSSLGIHETVNQIVNNPDQFTKGKGK